jgi:hypothetical protein
MDPLGALLAYHLPMQQQHPTQVWSNQTTPDLNSGTHESPSTNPITSAIDQSMVNIGMPPAPITISPGQASWDGLNYAPFGSLPPLYGTGSGASYVEPESAIADGGPLGPQLLALQGSLPTTGVDITRQLPKQPLIDAQIVRKQIFYYFNRVRKMQYWFAGESTKDVLRDIVVSRSITASSYILYGAAFLFHRAPCHSFDTACLPHTPSIMESNYAYLGRQSIWCRNKCHLRARIHPSHTHAQVNWKRS